MITVWDKNSNEYVNILRSKTAEYFMDKVSVDLFESASFYIVDSNTSRNLTITAKINSDSGLFKHYNVASNDLVILPQLIKTLVSTTISGNKVYQLDILWSCDSYVLDEANIQFDILDGSTLIGEFNIQLFAESVELESRYTTLLANHKFLIDSTFSKTFKESDVDEVLQNSELLNRKMLELLQNMHDIKSYTGSYRGLIDALKFFGYDDDLILHEYWRWYNNELKSYQYKTHDISVDYTKSELDELKTYERTNIFDLTYNINDYTDTTIDIDSPVTQLISVFSSAYEARIKLANIKQILEQYFLPAHVYIQNVIQNQYQRIGLREFNYIHNALVQHTDTNLSNDNLWVVDNFIKNRFYLSYSDISDSSNLQSNNIDQIVARTLESLHDSDYNLLNHDISGYDLTDINDFNFLKEKFVRHSTALILYKVKSNFSSLLSSIQKFSCTVFDAESDIVYYTEHFNPIVEPTDTIPDYIQLSIDKAGTFTIAIEYIDWSGISHVYSKTVEIKMYELGINLFTQRAPKPKVLIQSDYASFKQMNDAVYKVPAFNQLPKASDIDLFHYDKTLNSGDPVFNSTILPIYDFTQYPNISSADILYNTKQISKLHFDIPKISDLKDMRIDRTRNLIRSFNGCYLFMYFDIVGNGSAKTFDLALTYKNEVNYDILAISYAGHISDDSDYQYLKTIEAQLNVLPDSVIYGKFCWSVRLMKFAEEDSVSGIVSYSSRYVLTALSIDLDTPILYDTTDETKLNIEYRGYRHSTYTDVSPYIITRVANPLASPTNLTIQIDDSITVISSSATTLDDLTSELLTEKPDDFDVYVTDDTGSNTNEIIIVCKTGKSFQITHDLIGLVKSVYREASISDMVKVNQGFDATIYEPIAISVDDTVSYQPYDITWIVKDSSGNVIVSTSESVCKFWTKLSKHLSKDDYTLTAVWKDKYGTEYTDTFNSIVLIWRKLVDSKYETFTGLTGNAYEQKSNKIMWQYDLNDIETKPKWYLPYDQIYANIQVTSDSLTDGSNTNGSVSGPIWILANGIWFDSGYWYDTEFWNDI